MSDSNEPDILAGYDSSDEADEECENAKADLVELSEDDFQTRYKATKRQYRALLAGMKALHEAYDAMSESGPLEIDYEIIDATELLFEDFGRLLEQMHMAAYWEREGQ